MERNFTEQELVRREKLKNVEKPYPDKYDATHTISEARESHQQLGLYHAVANVYRPTYLDDTRAGFQWG